MLPGNKKQAHIADVYTPCIGSVEAYIYIYIYMYVCMYTQLERLPVVHTLATSSRGSSFCGQGRPICFRSYMPVFLIRPAKMMGEVCGMQ